MSRRIAVLSLSAVLAATWLAARVLADEPPENAGPDSGPDAGKLFAQLDTNKDGQLASDEIPEDRRRLFERLLRTGDKNNDGKLDATEFAAALKGSKPEADVPKPQDGPDRRREGRPEPGEMFKRLDQNNDGKVTIDEVPEPRREGFKKLIERGDKDGDGAVTQEELRAAFRALAGEGRPEGKRPEGGRPEAQQLFRRMDRNGDGKVTLDEAPEERRERLEKLIGRADKDGDKALTLEEFKTSLDKLAKQRGDKGKPPKKKPGKGKPGKGKPDKAARKAGLGGALPRPALFESLDSDHDGRLSNGEISAAADVIRKLDTNGDGSVSFEEIAAAK